MNGEISEVNGSEGVAAMRGITVSREYGSGGGEIAARLARALGWQLVDHEIVARVAERLREPEFEAAAMDEHAEGFMVKLGASLSLLAPFAGSIASEDERQQRHRDALKATVDAAIETGHVVIVGRGSQVALANRRDVLHLRVVAPLALRIAYVAERERLTPDAAKARIQQKDHDRQHYLMQVEHKRSDDAGLYDLVVNTGVLSLDNAVQLALTALELKGQRLSVPAAELGPGAGLTPYASPAGNFPTAPV